MNLLVVIAPGIVLGGLLAVAFAAYCALCAVGRAPQVAGIEHRQFSLGRHGIVYWHWVLSPIERFLVRNRVSPNAITMLALLASIGCGFALAFNHLATAGWLYVLSGTFDIIDGRLARATEQSSAAGGFLDSVADRWSEVAVFMGFAWLLRETPWFLAVIAALAGSMMVSYVRAAGEVRGTVVDGGVMKRPERVMAVSLGTLVSAALGAVPSTQYLVPTVLGAVLTAVGVGSVLTAMGRWWRGYKNLQAMDQASARDVSGSAVGEADIVRLVVGAEPRSAPARVSRQIASLGAVVENTASARTRP